MFRPERMTFISVVCLKRDIDVALEGLNCFGQFQIEEAAESPIIEYNQAIHKVESDLSSINDLLKQFNTEKSGLFDVFKAPKPIVKTRITAENWQSLAETVNRDVSKLKSETNSLETLLKDLREKSAETQQLKDKLTVIQTFAVDSAVLKELKLIHVTLASVPQKNVPELEEALTDFPVIFSRCYQVKNTVFICVAFPSKYQIEIERLLKIRRAEILPIPEEVSSGFSQALSDVNHRLEENAEKEKAAVTSLEKLGQSNKGRLFAFKEISENILALLGAKKKCCILSGLLPLKVMLRQVR